MIRWRRGHSGEDNQPQEAAPELADDEPGSAAGQWCPLCDGSMDSEATMEAAGEVFPLSTRIAEMREAAEVLAEEHKQAWESPRPDAVAEAGVVDEAVANLADHADAGAALLRKVHDFVHGFVPTWPRQQVGRWQGKAEKLLDRVQMLRWQKHQY